MSAGTKARRPAVEGWFDPDPEHPTLLGGRCSSCGTFSFPRATLGCPNPHCEGGEAEVARLSSRGRLWSFTDARYQPPPPYVAAEPYEPFCLAAVELADEALVVMGQVVAGVGVGDLNVGQEMELCVDTLYEDAETTYLVWKWRPAPEAPGPGASR